VVDTSRLSASWPYPVGWLFASVRVATLPTASYVYRVTAPPALVTVVAWPAGS